MSYTDPTDIEAQAKTREERAERERLAAKVEAEDLVWLLSSKRGRRIAHRMLERAGVFRLSFNANSMTMAFNEGMRNEGLRLLSQINTVAPERYAEMQREARE